MGGVAREGARKVARPQADRKPTSVLGGSCVFGRDASNLPKKHQKIQNNRWDRGGNT